MELLERQTQLEQLTGLLREAATSAGKMAWVSGEAGAGKSALVEQFAEHAGRSARVSWGYCDALETSRVLGPVNDVFAAISGAPGTTRETGPSREQLFSRLLDRLSQPSPVNIVVLEDLHWADEATLDFVSFLGRRIQRTRCLLITTYRDDELPSTHPLRRVLGESTGRHAARIAVPALSLSAVEQLARDTHHDARRVYKVSGGNPFFVRELLSTSLDTIPETVRDAVLARLMQCSPRAREVAEFVSLLPGRTDRWLVQAIFGDVGAAADETVARGLLRYHDETLAFRHELGRLAVESTVPRARAEQLHKMILQSLVEHHADLSRLVHHALHAGDMSAVLEYAPRAAEHAARAGAHREAAAHLAAALRLGHPLDRPQRASLLESHATQCEMTNQVAVAIQSATQALALWRELGNTIAQSRVLLLLGMQHWKAGQKTGADRQVAEAIALLEGLPQGRELAMAYSVRSRFAMTADDTEEALEFAQRALELAAQFGDHSVQAHALNNAGTALLNSGDESGLDQLEHSLAVALEQNLQEHAGRSYANLVETSVRQHRRTLALRYMPEGIEYCEVHEIEDCLNYIRAYAAHFELDSGRWDQAAGLATELIEHEALAVAQRIPALTALALVRARRGDPGVAPLLDEAARLAVPTGELQRIGRVAAARAEVAWYHGDLKAAAEQASIGLQAAVDKGDIWLTSELGFWGHRADPSLQMPANLSEPYALMIAGDWEHAASAWQRLGMPYEQALALAAGPEQALRESLAILEQLGAGPLSATVRQRLRALGVRGIPRGPRASTRVNPAGLTAREVQVLALLVRGHTNSELAARLHVSAKTVEHHVSSILEKLDVHSRTEAAAAAIGLGIVRASG